MATKQVTVNTVSATHVGYDNHGYPSAPPPEYSPNHSVGVGMVMQQQYTHVQYEHQQQQGPQQVVIVRQTQVAPPDHMVTALLVTLCCCCPIGIVAMIKANDAKNLYGRGNYDAAIVASDSAAKWNKAGLICGICFYVVFVVFCVAWIAIVAAIGYS